MSRAEEEKLIMQLNLAASKLLECYQWNHVAVNYGELSRRMAQLHEILAELQRLLNTNEDKNNDENV